MRFGWSDATSARFGCRRDYRGGGDDLSSREPGLSLRHHATRDARAMCVP
jgi:hypothetical protein